MIGARTISNISKSGAEKDVKPRKPKIIDQIPEDVQLRIVDLYSQGMSMRKIGEKLVSEGVPHPQTPVPWGTEAIHLVIKHHKEKAL
jgi:hypothetical protein